MNSLITSTIHVICKGFGGGGRSYSCRLFYRRHLSLQPKKKRCTLIPQNNRGQQLSSSYPILPNNNITRRINIIVNHMRLFSQQTIDDEEVENYCEPVYLELVTDTADRMRCAVRDYVDSIRGGGDSSEKRDGNVIDEYSNMDTSYVEQSQPPIKLVGILATTTSQPITSSNPNDTTNQQHQTIHPTIQYENDTHGNERYSEQISQVCATDGILYEPWRIPPTREALERAIAHANERLDVHGILVFYPVFDKLTTNDGSEKKVEGKKEYKCQETGVYYRSMDDYFRDLVASDKDVEGYCRRGLRIQKTKQQSDEKNVSKEEGEYIKGEHIVKAEEFGPIYPCTALAVYKILESFHHTPSNDDDDIANLFDNTIVTIINRSEVLGLPLATMLSNQGATVYSVNIDSILQFSPDGKVKREHSSTTLEECIQKSSVIVSGVPSHTFQVPTEWIQKYTTVINVAAETNFDEETICNEERCITYVPHVGRVTVAALEYNLMSLHQNYHSKSKHKDMN